MTLSTHEFDSNYSTLWDLVEDIREEYLADDEEPPPENMLWVLAEDRLNAYFDSMAELYLGEDR